MTNVRDIRLTRLNDLLREVGGKQVILAGRIKKAPAQLNQWLSGRRTITEETAREIETNFGLPPKWLDQPSESAPLQLVQKPAPTLQDAMEVVGGHIASMEQERRLQLAEELRLWALMGGQKKHADSILDTLTEPSKRAAAG